MYSYQIMYCRILFIRKNEKIKVGIVLCVTAVCKVSNVLTGRTPCQAETRSVSPPSIINWNVGWSIPWSSVLHFEFTIFALVFYSSPLFFFLLALFFPLSFLFLSSFPDLHLHWQIKFRNRREYQKFNISIIQIKS